MLGADGGMAHPFSFLMSDTEHPSSALGETFHTGQGKNLLYLLVNSIYNINGPTGI